MDRIYANIYFPGSTGADHTFCDFTGQTRLTLGSTNNEFLHSCVMPNLRAVGALPASSTVESVEIGRSGVAAMVRVASTYASIRLEGVGQSQNFTGFTLSRNNITQTCSALLGTVAFQSWGSGKNTFHRDTDCTNLTASGTVTANNLESKGLTLKASAGDDQSMTIQAGGEATDAAIYFSTPYNVGNAPKSAAIIVEGRGFYSRNNLHLCLSNYGGNDAAQPVTIADSCLKITPHDKHVSIPGSLSVTGSFSNSDSSIKENVRALSSSDALAVLRTVEAKVYDRTDGPLGTRVGFIAQHVAAALPLDWQNVVRSTSVEAETDSEGQVRPAEPGLLQIDYSRMGSPILWECCRNMLARIESLEARLQ